MSVFVRIFVPNWRAIYQKNNQFCDVYLLRFNYRVRDSLDFEFGTSSEGPRIPSGVPNPGPLRITVNSPLAGIFPPPLRASLMSVSPPSIPPLSPSLSLVLLESDMINYKRREGGGGG